MKEGKCFGTTCQGCLKHECEIDSNKTIVNPPEEYIKTGLKLNLSKWRMISTFTYLLCQLLLNSSRLDLDPTRLVVDSNVIVPHNCH